jgi:hypothetical protein
VPLVLLEPPAMSTLPLFSRVAVWEARGVVMLPVAKKVQVTGSMSSTVDIDRIIFFQRGARLTHLN